MENEIWKPIHGFNDRYKISNLGRIISINGKYNGEKIIVGTVDKLGYRSTTLRGNGEKRCVRIHTLIAETFLNDKPTSDFICVNHKDGNKLNNHIDNLEWTTLYGNVQHAVRTGLFSTKGEKHFNRKLNNEQVYRIKFLSIGIDNYTLSKQLGVSREQVRDIRLGKCWPHITEDYFSNSNSASVG